MSDITTKTIFLSDKGGTLDIVSLSSGEVLASVAVPAGRVSARDYLDLLDDGTELQVSDGLVAVTPPSRIGIQPYGAGSHDSGANPDFRPTQASRLERDMRLQIDRMKAMNDASERRARAAAAVERVPLAPAPAPVDDAPVIDPAPAPVDEVKTPK